MSITKTRLVALVAIACGVLSVLGGLWLHAQTGLKDGRVLSEGEMAAIFGDVVNNLCKSDKKCECTRTGQVFGATACIKCDSPAGGGATTTWKICCSNTGTFCEETGGAACQDLFIYSTGTYETAVSCCEPCRATSGQYANQNIACGSRKNASGDACP